MFTLPRITLSLAVLASLSASAAHGQTMRASCDNRAGGCFADVIDSSDPNQFNYNVDPSEIYRTFTAVNQSVSQNVGANLSSANISVNSRFIGANPGNHTTGFIIDNICHAQCTRSNTAVRAFSNDSSQVCFTVTGASAASPLRMRMNGAVVLSGGATGQLRLQSPSNNDVFNVSSGTFNRVLNLTANGEYRYTATLNTGDLQPSTPSTMGPRDVNIYASFVCMADFNGSGTVNTQDIFDFLSSWFAGNLASDTNANNALAVQDIFDFLSAWFTGCA